VALGSAGAYGSAAGQDSSALLVRVQVQRGRHYVGQGFELAVGVAAADKRPTVEMPRLAGAKIWMIGNGFRPVSVSGIGSLLLQENLFVTRYRVVPGRSGVLEIPAMAAHLGNQSGRGRPLRVTIERVPLEGRPRDFLGGVGEFAVHAEVSSKVVRVGQELDFRITVSGPAAWGMAGSPEVQRLKRVPLALAIQARPDEATDEPPSRTFVYRLRPMRAGEAVLPPVSISAFDPASGRYITHVTSSVPIRAAAVPAFNTATIAASEPRDSFGGVGWIDATVWILSAATLLSMFAMLVRVRRRWRASLPQGPMAARRYAAGLARRLSAYSSGDGLRKNSKPAEEKAADARDSAPCGLQIAHHVSAGMIRYLELGTGRPPGALTPDEARDSLINLTGRVDLGEQAGQLTARCDVALYAGAPAARHAAELQESARRLFETLGRLKLSQRRAPGARP
jgi:hypothetical protein